MGEPGTASRFAVVPGVDTHNLSKGLEVSSARSAIIPFSGTMLTLTSEFYDYNDSFSYDSLNPYRYYVSANSALPWQPIHRRWSRLARDFEPHPRSVRSQVPLRLLVLVIFDRSTGVRGRSLGRSRFLRHAWFFPGTECSNSVVDFCRFEI
jgi:hypothetical protein